MLKSSLKLFLYPKPAIILADVLVGLTEICNKRNEFVALMRN